MNEITRVVLDTNVLVSALRSQQGASYRLLLDLTQEYYQPCVSVPIFMEYEAVLKRQHLIQSLSHQEIDAVLNFLLNRSHIQPIFFLWRPYLPDPLDDMVLELAVASQSQHIITFNIKDFKGVELFGITAITPLQFLQQQGKLL